MIVVFESIPNENLKPEQPSNERHIGLGKLTFFLIAMIVILADDVLYQFVVYGNPSPFRNLPRVIFITVFIALIAVAISAAIFFRRGNARFLLLTGAASGGISLGILTGHSIGLPLFAGGCILVGLAMSEAIRPLTILGALGAVAAVLVVWAVLALGLLLTRI